MRVLVAGWFSFEQMGATAGDLLARDLVCQWLNNARIPYTVAVAPPFQDGEDWRQLSPNDYTHVLFVCGPFGNRWPLTEFLETFSKCRLIGLNLSMLESLEVWNPFDFLLERDSSRRSFPDITFASQKAKVPVVGTILAHAQKEYGKRARYDTVHSAIQAMIATRKIAVVPIDTRLDENATGLRTAAEVESLIARMDMVITTRLHGMVLALKNGVPALAIDPIAGGAKITQQAKTIGWPVVFTEATLSHQGLMKAFDLCLTKSARIQAKACAVQAVDVVSDMQSIFLRTFAKTDTSMEA